MNSKFNDFKKKPLSWLQSALKSQRFMKSGFGRSGKYRAAMQDSSAESTNWLDLLFRFRQHEPLLASAGMPSLLEEKHTSNSFSGTAASKLHEIADRIRMITNDKENNPPKKPVQNGQMAPNEEDIKQLGKEMDQMQTNKELKEIGLDSDPIQED